MNDDTIKKLALVITTNCTRESVLDECKSKDQINQSQLDLLNRQISDRLYTFLTYLLNKPAPEYSQMMETLFKHSPQNWPSPKIYPEFVSNQTPLKTTKMT